jgi:hypothetical protein
MIRLCEACPIALQPGPATASATDHPVATIASVTMAMTRATKASASEFDISRMRKPSPVSQPMPLYWIGPAAACGSSPVRFALLRARISLVLPRPLPRPRVRAIKPPITGVLSATDVRQQDVAKVPLAEHDNVVKAFPSDRTDQPFGICVLPRGTRRCRPIANAHGPKSSNKDLTAGPIQITDEIAGRLLTATSCRELIGDPFGGRMRCDAKPQDLPPAMAHDQQSIEKPERDCRNHEQIDRRDAVGMIAEECLPALGRRACSPRHILGDAGLADLDAELEQLAMDPRRSPQRIGNAHLADQPPDFGRHRRSAGTRS